MVAPTIMKKLNVLKALLTCIRRQKLQILVRVKFTKFISGNPKFFLNRANHQRPNAHSNTKRKIARKPSKKKPNHKRKQKIVQFLWIRSYQSSPENLGWLE